MGLKQCYIIAKLPRPTRSPGVAFGALLSAWRAQFFAPFAIAVWRDGEGPIELGAGPTPWVRWPGEVVVPASSLTSIDPQGSASVVAELDTVLPAEFSALRLRLDGALFHHPPGALVPGWHGHWVTGETTLQELVRIGVEGSATQLLIELGFHSSGYPLTATRLAAGRLEQGDHAIAAINRDLLVEALRSVATAFGVEQSSIQWSADGEFAHLYPGAGAALVELLRSLGSPAAPPDDDERFQISVLTGGSTADRAIALRNLATHPSHSPRVAAAIAALLEDRSACVLQIPLRYGEVRLLAALALAAARRAANAHGAIEIRCVPPQDTTDLENGLRRCGLPWPSLGGADAAIAAFEQLREHGALAEQPLRIST